MMFEVTELGCFGSVVRLFVPNIFKDICFVAFPTDAARKIVKDNQMTKVAFHGGGGVTSQNENSASSSDGIGGFAATSEDNPLVKSLRSILKELDDQYERERQNLIATLPNTSVKNRALVMLEARHHQRRENYLRELAALLERP
jgi:hypothetical protein